MARLSHAALLSLVAAACTPKAQTMTKPVDSKSPLAGDAIAGVTDVKLRDIIADHWEFTMRWSPTYATTLGDHRFDDKLAPRDAASIEKMNQERDALLTRLTALDPNGLGGVDRVTFDELRGRLEAEHGLSICKSHEWVIESGGGSVLGELSYLVESHTVTKPQDAENLIKRLEQGSKLVDDTIANLKLGLADGRVSSAEKVRRVIEQLDAELDKPVDGWAMATPKWTAAPDPDPWPEGTRDRLNSRLRDVVQQQIVPAVVRLRDFLRDELLPQARTDKEGLVALPDGAACYRASIFYHVGLAKTPEELHALGLAEIARTDKELAALGAKVLGTKDLPTTIAKLRDDKALYFSSREELLGAAQHALDKARAAIPRYFAVLPKADCVMREIPDYEAPYSTIAYYRQPHYDGTKPGEYFVNTYKPETRPKFELEALTWHESIPGHHLQIAIAQELGQLPMFRKLEGSTAFVEGWALYTERLAEEMGLYSTDTDRLGRVSYDAWRASRLVVDTGIHAMGWTRKQAEEFMLAHTALTPINISNEVDRYIGWPGQALAYKVGQIEILRLRAEAEQKLGKRFELKSFHSVVLGAGAVTLPTLERRVNAWVENAR
ncbi:MAG TPA: DUF885 domain-containing protein [Kofleriaceae bacterium]|nr:DUF885 domain-containing protein [Kofleriaceae bacterium]